MFRKIKFFIRHLILKHKGINIKDYEKLISNTLTLEQLARRDSNYTDYIMEYFNANIKK